MMSIELDVIPNIIRLDARKCDVPSDRAELQERAKQTFGWQPQISMEEGIREVGAWLSSGIIPPTQTQIIPQPAIIPAAVVAQMA